MKSNKALLVVDIQQALVDELPYNFVKTFENVLKLIDAFRKRHMEVIFVQHTEPKGELSKNSLGWKFYEQLPILTKDKVFQKYYNSAFKETGLDSYLRKRVIGSLVVVGLQTEFCIDSTVKAAFDLGYDIIIPEETNSTFGNPLLTAEQIYMHYNYFVWTHTLAKPMSVEKVIKEL